MPVIFMHPYRLNMINHCILILVQLLIAAGVHGQSGGLNMALSLPYPQGDFSHMIEYADTIVGYGVGFNNNIEWKQGLVLAKIDSSGNIIHYNFIVDAAGDKLATGNAWGNIIRTTDGGYAAIAATVGRKSAFLIKMDTDLQVEFIKEYPDTVNLSNFFYKLLETSEGYLLYGSIQRPDFYGDGFIRHVDKQGETIWLEYFDFGQFSTTVINVQPITDSTYIASFVSSTNIQENMGFTTFLVFHSNGDESGFWQFPVESAVGLNRKIIVTNEGDILAFGLFLVDIMNNTPRYKPTLVKFTDQFTIDWISHFGRIGSLNASVMLWDFAPTSDGHYIGAGETLVKDGNDPTRRVGWLYKFSTEGDSIWERKINAPFLPLYYTNSGFFAGVGVLSSGNIIAGGTTNEGNTDYCWLVKVTNDGCLDTLFCQPVSTVQLPENKPLAVEIYPLPASSYFDIQSPVELEQVTLFDARGMPVLKRQKLGTFTRIDVPGALPGGFYVVEIQDRLGNSVRKKIFVHR